ncbi:MAG: hypothetical protein NTX71_12445 [Candidatus Aureabacteria bacterium]|nr:hypothetical protein [Candidatus Auribacterota bacterium]
MKNSEIKTIDPASVFALFFSACFIIALIYFLAVNLQLMPHPSRAALDQLRSRIDSARPVPRSLAYAALVGVTGGVGGALFALVYNIFSSIFGGVKAEIEK